MGKKYYRFKDPVKHVKQAIGKFQSQHPYLSLLVEAPLVAGGAVGVAKVVTGGFARPQMPNIPVAKTVYDKTIDLFEMLMR